MAALPAAPVTTTAQPLPTALVAHAPEPVAKTEAAGRISAPFPTTAPATQAAAQAPTAAIPAIAVTAHLTNPQHLTIHLTPPELGKLEVRIDRPTDAPARVEIKVEHAHTLDLLSQDQPKLQQALDQAGVPAQRQLVLTLSDNGGDPMARMPIGVRLPLHARNRMHLMQTQRGTNRLMRHAGFSQPSTSRHERD